MMINSLREATTELHAQLEKENLARHIIHHTISLEDYKLLLLQNFIAYRATEREVARFFPDLEPSKHQRLQKDLENLGINIPPVSQQKNVFSCENAAEALGAAYVVEGSALGGRQISEELRGCPELEDLGEQFFFDPDRQNMLGWKKFKKMANQRNYSDEEISSATEKAKETFRFFRAIFKDAGMRTLV